jgi:hypothetical protein
MMGWRARWLAGRRAGGAGLIAPNDEHEENNPIRLPERERPG